MANQVQQLYKNESGVIRSLLARQFISFSYGGKDIEEFDLVATITGDAISKTVYAPFTDTTSNYPNIDGQIYWTSAFSPFTLTFALATDGIDSFTLEKFKEWFRPGVTRQLILSEYSNRYAYARVSSAPIMNVLPFEKVINKTIGGVLYQTSITEYKGSITLVLVMDDPYWYSITSYYDNLDFASNQLKLKECLEDRLVYPNCFSNITGDILLANNMIYTEQEDESGSHFKENEDGVSLSMTSFLQVYHAGSAAAKPIISFDLTIQQDDESSTFSFGDDDKISNGSTSNYYSMFLNEGAENARKFRYTLPDILLGYNKIIDIVNSGETDITKLRQLILDEVYNYTIRNYCLSMLDEEEEISIDDLKEKIQSIGSLTVKIDSKTGEAKVTYTFNDIDKEENCGNMIKSKYLLIDGNDDYTVSVLTSTVNLYNVKVDFENTYL